MSVPRWFPNPYNDADTRTISPESIKKQGIALMNQVFSEGVKSGNGGLYVGAGGAAYMYLHCRHALSNYEKSIFLPLAQNALNAQIMYYHRHPVDRNEITAFLLGPAGTYAVGAVLSKEVGNEEFYNDCITNYISAAQSLKNVRYLKNGSDELFVGRAGYLCGALWLHKELGYQPVPEEHLSDIWNTIILSGKSYAAQNSSPFPLMFSYYGTEYLGAAHGLCAILYMLLSFPKFLRSNQEASTLIKSSIDYYLSLQDPSGNFPCAMDEVGSRHSRRQDDMLVHWCHGAPGAVYMFAKAYLVYQDSRYLNACINCGELVWNRGLLRKGPGICHGVAGNGYVFILLYNLSNRTERKYLTRALKFAEFLSSPQFIKEARRPDSPFSLYEGVAGTVCFLMDLIHPEKGHFPFFDVTVDSQ